MNKKVLLGLTPIVLIPVAFTVAVLIGQPEIFGLGGMVRHAWVMWLFIPVDIVCIVIGVMKKAKVSVTFGILSIAALLLFGSYGFIFQNVNVDTYDNEALQPIEKVSGIAFPVNTKAAATSWGDYTLCQGIISSAQKSEFEQKIQNEEKWASSIDPTIKKMMPIMVQSKLEPTVQLAYDLFLFRNLDNGTYNVAPPQNVATPCVLIAYDCETGRFLVVSDCTIGLS